MALNSPILKIPALLSLLSILLCSSPRPATGETGAAAAVDARVEKLLAQMTLEEKISLLSGDTDGFSTKAIPRLNIPKLVMADGPVGVRNYGRACHFPAGSALAATWDTTLAERYGKALALEARARGVHIMLAPGVNICRTPLNGRNFEYFGEDPFLASRLVSAWIKGMQEQGVVATIKHFACNNQEWHRGEVNAEVEERALHEIYLPAFRTAVAEANVMAVMAAYNRVNGTWCSENDVLQNQILRGQLGFKGLIMSDWGATHSTTSLAKGLDLEMPSGGHLKPEPVAKALADGSLKQQNIDDAVRHILRVAALMGFLDRPQKREDLALDSKESAQVALEVARSAIVLLKNQADALPLDRAKIKKIAVYGPNAEKTPTGGGGSGGVNALRNVSFLDGIRASAGPGVEVIHVRPPNVNWEIFKSFPLARTSPEGKPGLNLVVRVENTEHAEAIQSGINLEWNTPFSSILGLKGATLIYTGELVAPEAGDWDLVLDSSRTVKVWLAGKQLAIVNGAIIHLEKEVPVPIRIEVGDYGTNYGRVRLSMQRPVMEDLAPARAADAVIFCGGLNNSTEEEGQDREFDLLDINQRLIKELGKANPRTIAVLNGGAALGMNGWLDSSAAVLHAWYLGQEGGTALGEVLFGEVNPSGRLCSTFDRTIAENPASANYPGSQEPGTHFPTVKYSEGLFIGYRGYDKKGEAPLFPFGFGLSYTSFEMPGMSVALQKEAAGSNGPVAATVSVEVKNSGNRAGAEVVQVYVGQKNSPVERPKRELKGFAKVMLQPGETKKVEIPLKRDAFAYWSPAKKDWVVDSGEFVIEAGASERDIRQTQTVKLQ